MEGLDRRELILGGLGLIVLGCVGTRREPEEPELAPVPAAGEEPIVLEPPAPAAESPPVAEEPPAEALSILERVMPRSAWTPISMNPKRGKPMGRVSRITVHHEGSPNVRAATGFKENAAILERIRAYHAEGRGWADIGYHYVIDPSGRIWEARPVQWQGAHVRNHNPHNIGVMVMGNFDLQQPTLAQLIVLPEFVRALRRKYGVRMESLRSHQEWMPTACPGRNLQPRFAAMRREGQFV